MLRQTATKYVYPTPLTLTLTALWPQPDAYFSAADPHTGRSLATAQCSVPEDMGPPPLTIISLTLNLVPPPAPNVSSLP